MIKKPCNVIGQEHILVIHLKVYVIRDKKTLFPFEFNKSFIRNYFYCDHNNLRPIKFTPGKPRHAWA